MNEGILQKIHEELVSIRQLLASQQSAPRTAPARAPGAASTYTGTSVSGDEVVLQPSEVVPNAGDVQVHFGKNNGVALSKLSERSLSWYATEQPPRLDSGGKPYPARPQETTLRNAARTLWHQNRGTLGQADVAPKEKSTAAAAPTVEAPSHPSDEEVPF